MRAIRMLALAMLSALALAGCQEFERITPPKVGRTANQSSATATASFAYVVTRGPSDQSGTVEVIATATNTVVATIDIGPEWELLHIATTPDGAFAYVTGVRLGSNAGGTVFVIATASNTVVATVGLSVRPLDVAITPDGAFAYVTGRPSGENANSVSVIATATNTVVATIDVGTGASEIAFTPDGAFVYLTSELTSTVFVIATATNTIVASVDGLYSPGTVAITPDGAFAYVQHATGPGPGPSILSVIATATNTIVATVALSSGPDDGGVLAISPDGAFVYTAGVLEDGLTNVVEVISTATNTVVATVRVGFGPTGLAITADGAFLYVTNHRDNTVSVIATATNTVVATVSVGFFDLDVAIAQVPLNQPPIASAGGPYSGSEGSPVALALSGSDPDGDALTFTWDLGDGTTGTGPRPPTSHTYADNRPDHSPYLVALTVTDPSGAAGTASTTVDVVNVAPTVGSIATPLDPVAVGTSVGASASFSDPGTLDTHTGVFSWRDATTSAAAITEANGSGSASGSHVYSAAGVYTLTLTVTDKDGGAGQSVFQFVVVFDPAAGFVTGGGWINSPVGAYTADPGLAGRATFGFVSRYQKGATVPTGNTEFQFHAGNLNFKSTSYQWLVIAGARAQYKGSGTINGVGGFTFLLSAVDGQVSGGGGTDKFRIKLWDSATGAVVYDNQMGDTEGAAASMVIAGGSIVIHR